MELQMKFSKKITADFKAEYNIFSPETQARAWHQPQYEGNLGIVYNLDDKIIGRFNLFAYGNRYAFSQNTEYKLNPVYDFNLEVEYRFNKQLGFWARFNNFTTKRHFYWYNYPTQRLNLMLGANYTF
jgi:outer membrane cobalamin receptor